MNSLLTKIRIANALPPFLKPLAWRLWWEGKTVRLDFKENTVSEDAPAGPELQDYQKAMEMLATSALLHPHPYTSETPAQLAIEVIHRIRRMEHDFEKLDGAARRLYRAIGERYMPWGIKGLASAIENYKKTMAEIRPDKLLPLTPTGNKEPEP